MLPLPSLLFPSSLLDRGKGRLCKIPNYICCQLVWVDPQWGCGGSTVRTGQQTPTIDPPLWTPHKKTIMIMAVRDLTSCLANLCIRCRPPIAFTILFGSFPRVFIDSSQASQNSAPSTTKDADIHFVRSGYSLKNTCCVQLNILL